jgi:hypothetical protein
VGVRSPQSRFRADRQPPGVENAPPSQFQADPVDPGNRRAVGGFNPPRELNGYRYATGAGKFSGTDAAFDTGDQVPDLDALRAGGSRQDRECGEGKRGEEMPARDLETAPFPDAAMVRLCFQYHNPTFRRRPWPQRAALRRPGRYVLTRWRPDRARG